VSLASVGGTLTTLVGLGITLGFVGLAFDFIGRALPDGDRRGGRRRSSFFGGLGNEPRRRNSNGNRRRNSSNGIFDTGRQKGGNLFAPPTFNSPRRSTRRPRQRLTGSNILDPMMGGRF